MVRLARLTFLYDAVEDRIRLVCRGDGQVVELWLTRRFCLLLLDRLAQFLQKTHAHMDKVPSGQEGAVLELEHQAALAVAQQPDPVTPMGQQPSPDAEEAQGVLITAAEVGHREGTFVLALGDDSAKPYRVALSRSEAHRFASALMQRASEANWALPVDFQWLTPSGSEGAKQPPS